MTRTTWDQLSGEQRDAIECAAGQLCLAECIHEARTLLGSFGAPAEMYGVEGLLGFPALSRGMEAQEVERLGEMAAAFQRHEIQLFTAIFHSCREPGSPVERRPLEDGMPTLPWVCPVCGREETTLDAMRFDLAAERLWRVRVRDDQRRAVEVNALELDTALCMGAELLGVDQERCTATPIPVWRRRTAA